jgi:hypothetical protein
MATSNTQAQLLSGSKIYEVLQYYYTPGGTSTNLTTLYGFIGNVTPWDNPDNPPEFEETEKNIKQVFKNIIAAKLVTSADISPVIERIDWESGAVYDCYMDDENMFAVGADGFLIKRFYVRNRFDQVFKCLWNNNNAPTTVEPQFLPGTFDNSFLVTTADGHKWKYMYSLDSGLKQKFFDTDWMPVSIGSNIPNPVETFAGSGSIEVVNIETVGQGYTSGGVTITISGDGQYANATALVNGAGYLYDVSVSNTGQNYTYSTVTITPSAGYSTPNVEAMAVAPTSPIGGHGFDPLSELGCSRVMVALEFAENENGLVPTDMTFYQIGLLLDPISQESMAQSPTTLANNAVYDATTQLFVSAGTGSYTPGQTIYQGANQSTATFIGKIASFDALSNVVRVINITGTPTINDALIQDSNGSIAGAIRTLLSVVEPDFITLSGYMAYIENREAITRSPDGTEQFRIVLSF